MRRKECNENDKNNIYNCQWKRNMFTEALKVDCRTAVFRGTEVKYQSYRKDQKYATV
jgi:hypothetical protein